MLEASKIVLETDTIPRVNLAFMDNTHVEEIEIVKKLGELVTAYQQMDEKNNNETNENEITVNLNAWLQHTIAHFARENELMQQTNFPAYPIHAQEHEIALNRMKRIARLWQTNKDIEALANFIFSFWPDWFNAHVNSMDMMTARFAVMNGYTG